jgi:predicted RNase H-like HicB family nuclease
MRGFLLVAKDRDGVGDYGRDAKKIEAHCVILVRTECNTIQGSPMQDIRPLRIDVETEDDGRLLASVPELPGVMAYAATEEEAVRKVKAIALQVLADMIETGESVRSA